jgi:tetratricopeptide (TPR) repeat protein
VRSSERRAARWGTWGAALLAIACGLGASRVRLLLVAYYDGLRDVNDVYALPSPEQTVGVSLGYRAALADLIYANTLVAYGIRSHERRQFEFVGNYLDTVIALDPTLRETYYFADTLLTLQTVRPPLANYEKAREILERGLEQFPYDPELWLVAGQYVAYLAPSAFAGDPEKQEQWRTAGARLLARACELGADDRVLTRKCIGAARALNRAGEQEATIRFLERLLALSDDPAIRAKARAMLESLVGHRLDASLASRRSRFEQLRQAELPFVDPDLYLLLGPPTDPARCAGHRDEALACATTFRDWVARLDDAPE